MISKSTLQQMLEALQFIDKYVPNNIPRAEEIHWKLNGLQRLIVQEFNENDN